MCRRFFTTGEKLRNDVIKSAAVLLCGCLLLFSCATSENISGKHAAGETAVSGAAEIPALQTAEQETLSILFGGDIMAHFQNFRMHDFDSIWTDITPVLRESDLALANLETPVDDERNYHTYPLFNVHHEYADAAVKAGFNVFSLANNHSGDQGLDGIRQTARWGLRITAGTAGTVRPVYTAGLKEKDAPFSFCFFTSNGWTILFLPVTEILNSMAYASYINYIPADTRHREEFVKMAARFRRDHPCDLFIISIHSHDEEYVRTIEESQRQFYYKLLDEGTADVIWANHPHVAKDWEIIGHNGRLSKLVMYANGNTISGQRRAPSFDVPGNARDYTGDGYLLKVLFRKPGGADTSDSGITVTAIDPVLITTYIDRDSNFVIRKLDDAFIASLTGNGQTAWANYLAERKKIMEKTKGNTIWR